MMYITPAIHIFWRQPLVTFGTSIVSTGSWAGAGAMTVITNQLKTKPGWIRGRPSRVRVGKGTGAVTVKPFINTKEPSVTN